MATRRSTFGKQDRERAKKAKAAAKRERRFDRSATDPDSGNGENRTVTDNPDDLLREIELLHQRFEDKAIDFEDFEERKLELFGRLAAIELP